MRSKLSAMVHTNATNVPGGGPRDCEKHAETMQGLGQNKRDCMNTFELMVVVLVVLDVIMVHNVLVIFYISVLSLVPVCTLSSLCKVTLLLVIINVLVQSTMDVVLVNLFEWCKMSLMCLRRVLAVTTLLIIIFVFAVIAVSSVTIVPELSTYVVCRLFYHDSFFLIIRGHKYMQHMLGGGPRLQGQL